MIKKNFLKLWSKVIIITLFIILISTNDRIYLYYAHGIFLQKMPTEINIIETGQIMSCLFGMDGNKEATTLLIFKNKEEAIKFKNSLNGIVLEKERVYSTAQYKGDRLYIIYDNINPSIIKIYSYWT